MINTKVVFGHTIIYGVGRILRGITSFVMLPIYTRYLSPADYGLIELLNVVLDLTMLFLGARVTAGIFKYYSDAQTPVAKQLVMSTAMMLIFLLSLTGIILINFFSDTFSNLLDAPRGFSTALKIFSVIIFFSSVNEIFFSYLRIRDKPIVYVIANCLSLFMQVTLNIIFIIYLDYGFWGIIWSGIVSSCALMVIFCIGYIRDIGLKFNKEYGFKLMTFTYPIILSSLAMYYITFGDRYFIKYYQGMDVLGLYSLAYKFGFMLVSLVWAPFTTYWVARQYEFGRSSDAPYIFGQVFFYANLFLLTAASGVIVLVPHFLFEFSDRSFWPAVSIVPWIVCAYVVQCWIEFMQFGILQAGRTKLIALGTLFTAVLITFFYIWLIPKYGAIGAAQATLGAFIFRFLYTYSVSMKFFPIRIPWFRLLAVIGYLLSVVWLLSVWVIDDLYALIIKMFLIIGSGICVLFLPIIPRTHRKIVYHAVSKYL